VQEQKLIIYFETPPGATEPFNNNPVTAVAIFTPRPGLLILSLLDLTADPKTVSQNISDLYFRITSGQTSGDLISSDSQSRTIHADGTFTDTGPLATGWTLDTQSGVFHLRGLDVPGAPANTIIGPPNNPFVYGSADSSIAGNGQNNPFLAGGVDFFISIPGLTEDSRFDGVVFSFGIEEGDLVPGIPFDPNVPAIPEVPDGVTTVLLLSLSVSGLAIFHRKLNGLCVQVK
jgi:hypothetical protein